MATTSTSSVVAFFTTEARATTAISALKTAGFQSNQIGAATSSGADDTTGSSLSTDTSTSMGSTYGTNKPADTLSNAAGTVGNKTEGAWDKIKNFFEGNEGGIEQYADENARDRSSHEVTGGYGYEAGDVSHSLGGMSVPDEHSRYFEHRLTGSTGVLVTVNAAGREQEAASILEENGGDLGSSAATYDYSAAPAASTTAAAGTQRIQLLGEVLRVHKDRISRGEVRIRKEVITENQSVQVPVTREELVIERIATTGAAVQGAIGQDSEIRIPLSEEQASIDKQTVVREEVSVGKRAIESVQEVGGSVRHEELQVEDETLPAGQATTTTTNYNK